VCCFDQNLIKMADLDPPAATPAAAATPATTPATTPAKAHGGGGGGTPLLLAASPSAKHEQRVRGMAFAFPWSTEYTEGQHHQHNLLQRESAIDDLQEQLAAANFAAEEKVQALLAQLELCEVETADELARAREDGARAHAEADRLRGERARFLEERAELERACRAAARDLEELQWSEARAEKQREAEQVKGKARAQEAAALLHRLRQEIETLKAAQKQADARVAAEHTALDAALELSMDFQGGGDAEHGNTAGDKDINGGDAEHGNTAGDKDINGGGADATAKASSSHQTQRAPSLSARTASVRAEIDAAAAALRACLEDNRSLTSKLRESDLAKQELEARLTLLTSTRARLEERASTLEAALADAEYNVEELRESLRAAEAESKVASGRSEHLSSAKLQALGDDLATTTARAAAAETSLADVRAALAAADTACAQLEEQARTATHAKEDMEDTLRLLRMDLDHAKSRRDAAEEDAGVQADKVRALETQARQREDSERQAGRAAEQEARALATANALTERRLEASVQTLQRENERLVEAQKALRARMGAEMQRFEQELRREAEEGGAKLHALETAKRDAEARLAEERRTVEDTAEALRAAEQENRRLEAQQLALDADATQATKNIEWLTGKVALLEEEKEHATSDLEAIKEELDTVHAENGDMRERVSELQSELERATATGSELRQCLVALEDREERHTEEIRSLTECVASLRESLRQSEEAVDSATKECDRQARTLERRVAEKAQLVEERGKLVALQAEADRELMQLRARENDLRGELASLLEEKRRAEVMRRRHADLKRKHQGALAEVEELKRKAGELEQKTSAALMRNLEMRDNEMAVMRKRMRGLAGKVGRMDPVR
jgi:chromosome segregation ATPase